MSTEVSQQPTIVEHLEPEDYTYSSSTSTTPISSTQVSPEEKVRRFVLIRF